MLVVLPPHVAPADARAYWERRAAELCPAGVEKRIVFRHDAKGYVQQPIYNPYAASSTTRVTTAIEVEGYVYCKAP